VQDNNNEKKQQNTHTKQNLYTTLWEKKKKKKRQEISNGTWAAGRVWINVYIWIGRASDSESESQAPLSGLFLFFWKYYYRKIDFIEVEVELPLLSSYRFGRGFCTYVHTSISLSGTPRLCILIIRRKVNEPIGSMPLLRVQFTHFGILVKEIESESADCSPWLGGSALENARRHHK